MRYTDDPLEFDWEEEEYPQGDYQEEYIPEPPVRNVTNMEQFRGQPNTVFIDERGTDELAARKIREYGPNGEIISEEQMPKRSDERIPAKPDEKELDIFTKLKDFEKQWLPQAQKEADEKGKQAAEEYISKKWDVKAMSEKALSFGDEKARIQANARAIYDKVSGRHIDALRKVYTPLFKEAYSKELQREAKKETVRQESIKNEREKKEEQGRYERNQADREAAKAAAEAERKEAAKIRAEERESVRAAKAEKDAQDRADRLAKASEAKSADLTKLDNIIFAIDKAKREPTANELAIIKELGEKTGFEYVNIKGEKPGLLYGTNPTSKWELRKKEISETDLYEDLIRGGRTPQSAKEYIAKAKAKGLIK